MSKLFGSIVIVALLLIAKNCGGRLGGTSASEPVVVPEDNTEVLVPGDPLVDSAYIPPVIVEPVRVDEPW